MRVSHLFRTQRRIPWPSFKPLYLRDDIAILGASSNRIKYVPDLEGARLNSVLMIGTPHLKMTGDSFQESFFSTLEDYELHGWKPDPTISFDANVMDLVMLVTRTSDCRQGSMACILVQAPPAAFSATEDQFELIRSSIVSVSTNRSLFTVKNSDVHAEIGALGTACRRGRKTEGCSAYITMPPCRVCFGALVAAGIKRVVTRMPCLQPVLGAAENLGIELIVLDKGEERMARINALIYGHREEKQSDLSSNEMREAKRQK